MAKEDEIRREMEEKFAGVVLVIVGVFGIVRVFEDGWSELWGCESQDLLCLECGMDVVFIGRGE